MESVHLKRITNHPEMNAGCYYHVQGNSELPGTVIVTRGDDHLCLYSEYRWEKICANVASLPLGCKHKDAIIRNRIAMAQRVVIKKDVLQIPWSLLDCINFTGKDLVLTYKDQKGILIPEELGIEC